MEDIFYDNPLSSQNTFIVNILRGSATYTGGGEEVQCSWCGVVLGDWQYGDQVSHMLSINTLLQ